MSQAEQSDDVLLAELEQAHRAERAATYERGRKDAEDRLYASLRGTIGWAMLELDKGKAITRQGWEGRDQFITLQRPDPFSKMNVPYAYITTARGERVPWSPSQIDLLARDWELA